MKILFPFIFFIELRQQWRVGIYLPHGTKNGGGLMFPHFSGIVIHPNTEISCNCTIFQCGTTRSHSGSEIKGKCVIGDNVVIFSGAKIICNIILGNNVVVGENAVVLNDVPDNAVVVGLLQKKC